MLQWLAILIEEDAVRVPPPYSWSPHEWMLLFLTILIAERIAYWAIQVQRWFNAQRDPDAPTTKADVQAMLDERFAQSDEEREVALGRIQRMADEAKNSILLEMRPWKAEFESVVEALRTLTAYERAKADVMKLLREGNS